MARGPNDPPPAGEPELLLWLMFADGAEQYSVDPREAAAVLRGYAVPARFFRSRRVFDMVAEYVEKHADHRGRRGSDAAEPDIHGWDRDFMAQVDDTDTLYDLLRVRSSFIPPTRPPSPSPKLPCQKTHLLVAVDKFTKWVEVEPVSRVDGASAVRFFKR